ncbi:HpsJ family protein [Leptolyngbya sp. FACHB-261]|uniref:HpsJ-like protein, cyanoexosortase C-associated n=1 Tax=Leptolyngbya sp. FACHB-261 TaxID=2692806 RepID=UPI00168344F1|nr:HpsJ family protein [Leptolyngbya sp. FACHB-261]MBD2101114.1 hypothetical protein [Leptolyngbya sp. FACHB-261]
MATTSVPNSGSSSGAKILCRIVGFTCLAGFVIDMLALGFPPDFGNLEWRIGFLQQLGDRSIILLFGTALTIYGSRNLIKQLTLICLILGIVFHLSCILLIRDSLTLQQQTDKNITAQAAQLQTQIQSTQANPQAARNLTPEQLQQASNIVASRAETLRQGAKTGILKTGISSIGNLIAVGFGLISLGRCGARLSKG